MDTQSRSTKRPNSRNRKLLGSARLISSPSRVLARAFLSWKLLLSLSSSFSESVRSHQSRSPIFYNGKQCRSLFARLNRFHCKSARKVRSHQTWLPRFVALSKFPVRSSLTPHFKLLLCGRAMHAHLERERASLSIQKASPSTSPAWNPASYYEARQEAHSIRSILGFADSRLGSTSMRLKRAAE